MQRRYVSYQWSGVGTGWKNSLLGRDWTSFINIWTVIDCWGCFLFPLRHAVGTFCYQNTLHLISYLDGCSCWSSINYASIKKTWHFFFFASFFFFLSDNFSGVQSRSFPWWALISFVQCCSFNLLIAACSWMEHQRRIVKGLVSRSCAISLFLLSFALILKGSKSFSLK